MLGRRRRKPHPRSIDALFPRPKKPAVKKCPKGHFQARNWRPGSPCRSCDQLEAERIAALNADLDREEFSRQNPCGPVHTIRVVSTGRLIRYTIPRGLRPDRRKRRRRPGRRPKV